MQPVGIIRSPLSHSLLNARPVLLVRSVLLMASRPTLLLLTVQLGSTAVHSVIKQQVIKQASALLDTTVIQTQLFRLTVQEVISAMEQLPSLSVWLATTARPALLKLTLPQQLKEEASVLLVITVLLEVTLPLHVPPALTILQLEDKTQTHVYTVLLASIVKMQRKSLPLVHAQAATIALLLFVLFLIQWLPYALLITTAMDLPLRKRVQPTANTSPIQGRAHA